ncbi:FtsJ-like methyltransferase family protein [Abeliophyllum distichum]|uniref:FtsJ-like methyltransferase family protein n=1 Tax=Abeliophyllum distichum TaxID=126358 RepID=A0ABD1NN94_9LAMI
MPVGSLVIGVDLDPIRPIRGAISVQEDITQPKCRAVVEKIMAEYDAELLTWCFTTGRRMLVARTFVTKVFRSQDYSAVIFCLRQLFEKVEVNKPQASRSASAEIYIICFNYKAPAKIDPDLLCVMHQFQGGSGWESRLQTSFKLRWRMHTRKALPPSEKATSAITPVENVIKEDGDEDEKLLNEMEELTNSTENMKKKAKKLLAKGRAKDKARKALGKQIGATEDGYTDHESFSLTSIKAGEERTCGC